MALYTACGPKIPRPGFSDHIFEKYFLAVVSMKYGFFLPLLLPFTMILSLYAESNTTW